VELDCWDGTNNQPLIYHGHTLTTRLQFRDVITTIHEYAFRTSPFPVILSFENHCSVPQQVVMARIMLSVFGDRLVRAPLADNEIQLPSPHDLRYKILVKAKKGDHFLAGAVHSLCRGRGRGGDRRRGQSDSFWAMDTQRWTRPRPASLPCRRRRRPSRRR
jgi:hypothetical protein